MARQLLITGGGGFVGRTLVRVAADAGFAVTASGRGERPAELPQSAYWVAADLARPEEAARLSGDWWGVVHLATDSVPANYASPAKILESLSLLLNLAAAVRSGRLLYVSSCHVYAPGPEPKREAVGAAPVGPYGAAKAMAEIAALAAHHLDVRVARPFNHVGAGMQQGLLLPALLERIAAAAGDAPIVMAGRNSLRDFLDVRDICAAYLAILALDDPHERVFNVCSGEAVSIGTLAQLVVAACGRDNPITFREAATSADDVDTLVGDPVRLREATGWTPAIPLRESVRALCPLPA